MKYELKPITGRIKFYIAGNRYGFIKPDDHDVPDVFFHRRDLDFLPETGTRVAFTVIAGNGGGPRAAGVRKLDEAVMREIRSGRPRSGFGLG